MELLRNGFTLEIPPGCFPLSTDSMVLAQFVSVPKNGRVLDLGSGCGTLGLLLCSRYSGCRVTGIEQDETAHLAALENIRRNGLEHRMESILGDLRTCADSNMAVCVSNPPYFSGGPKSIQHGNARREDTCTLADLMKTAGKALKFGGDFYIVHRPERLGELISLAGANKLEAKRLLLLRHRTDGDIGLIFLQLRKGAHPGLQIAEAALRNPDGTPTDFYREVYGENAVQNEKEGTGICFPNLKTGKIL